MRSALGISITVALALWHAAPSNAADPQHAVWEQRLGKPAPLIVATSATGPWAAKYPFDPGTYGLVRGHSPGTASKGANILVYARALNGPVLALVSRLDSLVADNPRLGTPFVHLYDVKGAQRGGYTADELRARIAELQELAVANKLTHVSTGIASSPGSAAQVGLDDTHDLVIVYLAANKDPAQRPTVAWYRVTNSTILDANALQEMEASLRRAIAQ
jgi:hypothetical protein